MSLSGGLKGFLNLYSCNSSFIVFGPLVGHLGAGVGRFYWASAFMFRAFGCLGPSLPYVLLGLSCISVPFYTIKSSIF